MERRVMVKTMSGLMRVRGINPSCRLCHLADGSGEMGLVRPESTRDVEGATNTDGVPGHSSRELLALARALAPKAPASVLEAMLAECL